MQSIWNQQKVWLVWIGLVGVVALVGGLAPTAAAQEGPPSDAAAVVRMTNQLRFVPQRVTIPEGGTVRWENTSNLIHTVTAVPELAADKDHVRLPEGAKPFNSGNIRAGGVYTHTFPVPGLYRYFCIPHEAAGMIGEVLVEPRR